MNENGQYDRRSFLGMLSAAGVALTAGPVLAACSSGGSSSGAAAGASVPPLGPGTSTIPLDVWTASTKTGLAPPVPRAVAGAMNTLNNSAFASLAKAMETACKNNGVPYSQSVANGDPQLNVQQLNTFLAKGVGGIYIWDLDVEAQRPIIKKFMEAGTATFTISNGPAFTPMVADEVRLGEAMAQPAVDWITSTMGGEAEVLLFNLDSQAGTRPHTQKIRDMLTALPGVKIVADVLWDIADPNFGFTTMNNTLQAHPNVKVCIGDDPVVASALSAVEAAKKVTPDMFFIGVGGSELALEKIKEGGAYHATVANAWPVMGYAAAQWSIDWIDGKEIPSLAELSFTILDSAAKIDEFLADMADPEAAFKNKLAQYQPAYGVISYETRDNYWNSTTPGADLATRPNG